MKKSFFLGIIIVILLIVSIFIHTKDGSRRRSPQWNLFYYFRFSQYDHH